MPDKDTLLVEYRVCNQAVLQSAARCWQSVALIIGGSFAAVSLLARVERPEPLVRLLIMLIGLAAIIALILLARFVKREEWRQKVHFVRLRQIEETLGMRSFWDIHVLDNWDRVRERLCQSAGRDQDRYLHLHDDLPSPGPFGWTFIRGLVWIGVVIWAATVIYHAVILVSLLGWIPRFA